MGFLDDLNLSNLRYQEKILPINLPILEIFKRVQAHYDNVFFLESLGEDAVFSRYSYIGFQPTAIIRGNQGLLEINGQKIKVANPYESLGEFKKIKVHSEHFCGGLVGYFGYEAARFFDDLPFLERSDYFPDFELGLYLDGLCFIRKTSQLKYFYCGEDRSSQLLNVLKKSASLDSFKVRYEGTDSTQTQFERMVKKSREHILAGDCFQVVLSRRHNFTALSGSPLFFYERLRELNPSPHMFYVKFGNRELIGSSPELIVRLENGQIHNFPLAGTTKRGWTETEDAELAQKLLANEKERAEHMMLVDLGRNDVGRVSRFGTVQVEQLMKIKKFSHVQHIGSEIVGQMASDKDMFDVLKANSPMGTVSGAPKIETMKIIHSLEPQARGPYAGSVGYFGLNGNSNFAIAIRSLFKSDRHCYLQSGAGVVFDSLPRNEFIETQRKSQAMVYALTGEEIIC